jgi:hypothetical protein
VLPVVSMAQKADTVKKEKNDFFPTGVRVGMDAISFVRSQTDEGFSGYEVSADVDFYRYYLALEAGRWERTLTSDREDYTNRGNYARLGIDVNFLKKDPDKNMLFVGGRYGWGTFSERLSTTTDDSVWGPGTSVYTNTDVKASWAEITTGLRIKMWKFFWMGYTARYKFALNTNEPRGFIPHDVPGYGKTDKSSTWGFNYNLLFRIPIRKQK